GAAVERRALAETALAHVGGARVPVVARRIRAVRAARLLHAIAVRRRRVAHLPQAAVLQRAVLAAPTRIAGVGPEGAGVVVVAGDGVVRATGGRHARIRAAHVQVVALGRAAALTRAAPTGIPRRAEVAVVARGPLGHRVVQAPVHAVAGVRRAGVAVLAGRASGETAMGVAAVAVGGVAVVAFFGKLRRGSVAAHGAGDQTALRHEHARRGVATRAGRAHAAGRHAPAVAGAAGGVAVRIARAARADEPRRTHSARPEGWIDDPRTCGLGRRAGVSCVASARRPQGSADGDRLAPDHEVGAGNAEIRAVDRSRDRHLTALEDDRAAPLMTVVASDRPRCAAVVSPGAHLAV